MAAKKTSKPKAKGSMAKPKKTAKAVAVPHPKKSNRGAQSC